MPSAAEAPITGGTFHKWGPLIAGAVTAIVVTAFGWGVQWALTGARISALENKASALELEGSRPMQQVISRIGNVESQIRTLSEADGRHAASFEELNRRLEKMDRKLLVLVCRSSPANCTPD